MKQATDLSTTSYLAARAMRVLRTDRARTLVASAGYHNAHREALKVIDRLDDLRDLGWLDSVIEYSGPMKSLEGPRTGSHPIAKNLCTERTAQILAEMVADLKRDNDSFGEKL